MAERVHTMQCLEVWGGNGVADMGAQMPGLDLWVYARPHAGDEAGGDIHYVSSCGTGRISRVMVADVAGHGASVAAVADSLRSLMRRYVNFVDQARFVNRMNAEFTEMAQAGRFATAVIATYFAPTGHFSATNAGHPPPLVYSARTRTWRLLTSGKGRAADEQAVGAGGAGTPAAAGAEPEDEGGDNLPLGIVGEYDYESFSFRMRAGDIVVLYTDSLMEAAGPGGKQLGTAGLLKLARGVDVARPETIARDLHDRVVAASGAEPGDDVTILVLRPNTGDPEYGLRQKVSAQLSFLRMAAQSVVGGGPAPWPEMSAANILGSFLPHFNKRAGGEAREL